MEKEELRKLIKDAFAAMNDESNREAIKDIMGEYAPIVFLRKGVSFVLGTGHDVGLLVGNACTESKDFRTVVKLVLESLDEYDKEKSAHAVQANA